jgi:hypothetical protein
MEQNFNYTDFLSKENLIKAEKAILEDIYKTDLGKKWLAINSLMSGYKNVQKIRNAVGYYYPTRKVIIDNALNYLRDNRVVVQTIDIVKFYHLKDIENNITVRDNLVRRYSGRLSELVEEKKLFKKPISGKKGNWYTYYEELLAEKIN